MATMISFATDWTYDLFMEDASLYKAKPMKGVHCSSSASDREKFMTWLKDRARDFKAEWLETHTGMYDRYDGWAGDMFMRTLADSFSDYYKDAYGQRPHLDGWFYLQATDLPSIDDIGRTFCATPVADAIRRAKRNREEA